MPNRALPRFAAGVVSFVLLLAACTSGSASNADGETSSTATSAADTSEPAAASASASFCDAADDFITDRSVTDVALFSAEFFAGVDERLAALLADAPDELRPDLESLRAGFAGTDTIFAEFDYDVTRPGLGDALEQVDNEGMLNATDNIQIYLGDECGISSAVDPREVDDIIAAFGVDRALAECINLELGDVANIDSEDLTPELLQREVCGTSLIALLSGAPPTG